MSSGAPNASGSSTTSISHSASPSNSSTFLDPRRTHSLSNFIASDTPITIIPSFTYKRPFDFLLTHKSIGPLHAGVNSTVPLWLALYLRRRNLCRLVPPEWMKSDHLRSVLAYERDPMNSTKFCPNLPSRYVEIGRAVLSACGAARSAVHAAPGEMGGDEVGDSEVVRILLEDISTVRMDKIRRSVHQISADMAGASSMGGDEDGGGITQEEDVTMNPPAPMNPLDVNHIGSAEIGAIRPFLEEAFSHHLRLVRAGLPSSGSDSRPGGRENRDPNQSGENIVRSANAARSRIRRFR